MSSRAVCVAWKGRTVRVREVRGQVLRPDRKERRPHGWRSFFVVCSDRRVGCGSRASSGVDLVTTLMLVGHESVATTAIYTRPTESDLGVGEGRFYNNGILYYNTPACQYVSCQATPG